MVISVRPITNEEGNKLRRTVRHGREPVEVRRAQVILASAQGFTSPKISLIVGMSEGYIRELIHRFNEEGMKMLKAGWKAGGNWRFTKAQKSKLVELATSRPKDLNLPFRQWSLARLRDTAVERDIVDSISIEWLRVILQEAEVSFQSVKTWKESNDPEFEEKKRRIEELTRQETNPPIILSMDEIGPISIKPHAGQGWFQQKHPGRIPATYKRTKGIRYEYMCVNVFHQKLSIWQQRRKGGKPWLQFLIQERSRYPRDQDVYVIQDNLSAHWTPKIRRWAKKNRVTLVATATGASWMNPIECHAGDIQKLALDGTDFKNWTDVGNAFRRAVAFRNKERKARGKTFRDTQKGRTKSRQPLWTRH